MKYGVVIGTQRTGTTVLRTILSTNLKVQAFGEVFLNRDIALKESFYNFLLEQIKSNIEYAIPSVKNNEILFSKYLHYLKSLSGSKDCITIDCKYNFLQGALVPGEMGIKKRPFLLHLFRKNNFKLIHLIRKDVLATYVSSLLSIKNQVWATEDLSRLKTRSVEIPTENLLLQLRARVEEQKYFSDLLSGFCIELTYEDLIKDGLFSSESMEQIACYLNLENDFNLVPKLKKMAPKKSESIINYRQVCQVLENSEFEQYLE